MTTFTTGQMTALAEQAGFDKETAVIMGAIGQAESSGDSNAHNNDRSTGDNSYGLWQINMLPRTPASLGLKHNDELYMPKTNAAAAFKIYKSQGLNAWSTYKDGKYKKYLKDATADRGILEHLDAVDKANESGNGIDPLMALALIAEDFGKGALWISTPSNWLKVLYVIGGGAIVLAGIYNLTKDTAAGSAAKSVARNSAPVVKAAPNPSAMATAAKSVAKKAVSNAIKKG